MKRILFFYIFLLSGLYTFGQNSSKKSNDLKNAGIDQYKKTFEIKDNFHPDKTTLSKIDISKYEKLRKDEERVQTIDEITGFTIVLYSKYEMKHGKNADNELQILPININNDTLKTSGK